VGANFDKKNFIHVKKYQSLGWLMPPYLRNYKCNSFKKNVNLGVVVVPMQTFGSFRYGTKGNLGCNSMI
jgi:hypothetical protein